MKIDNFYDINAQKKATNLSINSDLLMKAKEHHINLSKTLENCLIEILAEVKSHEWKKENRDAIEAYNHRIRTKGVFSEGLRKF
jgi:antitoxin CcdA